MGNFFPRQTNLKESPELFEKTIKLIEKSFQYKNTNSFLEDFAPLMDKSNHQNCFVLVDENNEVIAHIGVKERVIDIEGDSHPLCLIGGIAVDEDKRGEGVFKSLMQEVLSEKRSDCAFFVLWSDQEKLYKKFGFHLCGPQYEYQVTNKKSSYEKTKYSALSSEEKRKIQELYKKSFSNTYVTLKREETDWRIIENIASADLYVLKSNGTITSYFFMNKGQDLGGIIYEYGPCEDNFLQEMRSVGTVWTGTPIDESNTQQFQFMLSPADPKLFISFIESYTRGQFKVRKVDALKGEVFFDFEEETLSLEIPEFLQGALGPGPFEELGKLRPIFFSGLDSI